MDYVTEIVKAHEFTLVSALVRIFLAFIAGFIIGFERERHNQPAGLRTHILICVSSALIMLVSLAVGSVDKNNPPWQADASRIAAQVVSGIGFLGAGVIIHQGINIRGLTSAATIWSISAVGLAIGLGLYVPAFAALLIILIVLNVMESFERRFLPSKETNELLLLFQANYINMKKLIDILISLGITVEQYTINMSLKTSQVKIHLMIRYRKFVELQDLTENIQVLGDLQKIRLTTPE